MSTPEPPTAERWMELRHRPARDWVADLLAVAQAERAEREARRAALLRQRDNMLRSWAAVRRDRADPRAALLRDRDRFFTRLTAPRPAPTPAQIAATVARAKEMIRR